MGSYVMMTETEDIELISENLKRYRLHQGKIMVFEPTGVNRATVDAWHDSTVVRKTSLTPYSRQRAFELVQSLGDRSGRSAIVIEASYAGNLIGFFVSNIFSRIPKNRPRRVFTDFQQAVKWLEEAI
jgi:hypothetical protein